MMTQGLPFDARTLARTENPITSKDAAAACRDLRGEHHAIILRVMMRGGDWNADELAMVTPLDRHQIGRRLGELERAGYVRLSGAVRPSATGRGARCYEVCR